MQKSIVSHNLSSCCVAVFVQSMSVLSALCQMLEERLGYAKDADYLRMDGSVSVWA